MTKRQALISSVILIFGIIVIPIVLSKHGHPGIASGVFIVSFFTFCYWPKEPRLPYD